MVETTKQDSSIYLRFRNTEKKPNFLKCYKANEYSGMIFLDFDRSSDIPIQVLKFRAEFENNYHPRYHK